MFAVCRSYRRRLPLATRDNLCTGRPVAPDSNWKRHHAPLTRRCPYPRKKRGAIDWLIVATWRGEAFGGGLACEALSRSIARRSLKSARHSIAGSLALDWPPFTFCRWRRQRHVPHNLGAVPMLPLATRPPRWLIPLPAERPPFPSPRCLLFAHELLLYFFQRCWLSHCRHARSSRPIYTYIKRYILYMYMHIFPYSNHNLHFWSLHCLSVSLIIISTIIIIFKSTSTFLITWHL